jgi:hypothetical protein
MSVVCILAPVVVAGWPAFSAAVVAAATTLGYSVLDERSSAKIVSEAIRSGKRIELEVSNSELVTGTLGRDQRITVHRAGVTVIFSRDARNRASLCVFGHLSDDKLRAAGEELSRAVVQSYVHQRLKDEMQARDFSVVEEVREDDGSIRMRVRHWEN